MMTSCPDNLHIKLGSTSSALPQMNSALVIPAMSQGTLTALYQQLFETYLHHHPVSAAISKLNSLTGRMALTHHSTFVIALL